MMWAFGGEVASEGLHLPHTASLFKRDSAQRGGGEGSKLSLPSTPTLNMGEWESLILYLTSRCLSGFRLSHQQLVPARLMESDAIAFVLRSREKRQKPRKWDLKNFFGSRRKGDTLVRRLYKSAFIDILTGFSPTYK